jgi:hypothetical protein
MHRARPGCRFTCRLVLATVGIVFIAVPSARGQLRLNPAALTGASPELSIGCEQTLSLIFASSIASGPRASAKGARERHFEPHRLVTS